MGSVIEASRVRSQRLLDERAATQKLHESLLANAEGREDKSLSDAEKETLTAYRTRVSEIDVELEELGEVLELEDRSADTTKALRSRLNGNVPGQISSGENKETVYRTFAAYARDQLITKYPDIALRAGGNPVKDEARERLLRAPAHTITDDVEGLLPPQHIQQIMDVIDANRPVVVTGNRVNLQNGRLTWPKITSRPRVRVQGTEKTETSSVRMGVDMEDETADTYLGAGNLSWQAINWTTPDALELWFRLAAEAYAIETEAAACHTLAKAASTVGGGAALSAPGGNTFAEWMAAVAAGIAQVYDETRAIPDKIYLSADMFFDAAALVSNTNANLINAGSLNLAGLSGTLAGLGVVASAGFASGTAIVGDSKALLVGETPGAPVELRAVEPSIGGMEVGVIGAFKSISFDDERFADVGPST
jgi:hypothetical protein